MPGMTSSISRPVMLAPVLRSAQWSLPTGAGGMLWLHRGAQGFMLVSGVAAWVWALSAAQAIWPLMLALAWSWHLTRLWRAWLGSGAPMVLQWHEPPASDWCVPAWGDVPVSARIVWEGQAAWLMHLRSVGGAQESWLWVRDDGGRDTHRLRTLLSLPTGTLRANRAPVA